jgi:hypothetical protein
MPAGTAFGICGLAGAIATIAFIVLLARWSRRTLALPDEGPPVAAWNGGLHTRTINATVGIVRLEMFSWGIRVRGNGPARWLVPVWEVRYEELVKAQLVTFPVANRGVLMRTNGAAVPLVFITFRGHEILGQLEARGVPTDRAVARLYRAELS